MPVRSSADKQTHAKKIVVVRRCPHLRRISPERGYSKSSELLSRCNYYPAVYLYSSA